MKTQKLHTLYLQWCKETKRNGSVLIGSSIREFFEWVEEQRLSEQEYKDTCAKIMRDNITFSPQTQDYIIHGALEELWKLYK